MTDRVNALHPYDIADVFQCCFCYLRYKLTSHGLKDRKYLKSSTLNLKGIQISYRLIKTEISQDRTKWSA